MRILLGIAGLILLFGISSLWHRSERSRLRAASGRGDVHAASIREHPAGWGEVIVGAASGARAIAVEPLAAPLSAATRLVPPSSRANGIELAGDGGWNANGALDDNRLSPPDWELEVRDGDILSRIVRVHYGRVSPELEQSLAEYNGLSSPDKLKIGQTLYLPPEERLVEPPR